MILSTHPQQKNNRLLQRYATNSKINPRQVLGILSKNISMKPQNITTIFDYLAQHYPDATTELHRETPFQLVTAVILSAQTTDKQVNKVTTNLREHISHPQDVVKRGEEKFNRAIQSIGLHNSKAKNIYRLSLILIDQQFTEQMKQTLLLDHAHKIFHTHGYYIPSDIKLMTKLPGIGIKTAKVV